MSQKHTTERIVRMEAEQCEVHSPAWEIAEDHSEDPSGWQWILSVLVSDGTNEHWENIAAPYFKKHKKWKRLFDEYVDKAIKARIACGHDYDPRWELGR